jgi:thymidylate synthase (FAD)
MTGNIRSWLFYIDLRTKEDTQKEHRIIAEEIKKIFIKEFPATSCALNWL